MTIAHIMCPDCRCWVAIDGAGSTWWVIDHPVRSVVHVTEKNPPDPIDFNCGYAAVRRNCIGSGAKVEVQIS